MPQGISSLVDAVQLAGLADSTLNLTSPLTTRTGIEKQSLMFQCLATSVFDSAVDQLVGVTSLGAEKLTHRVYNDF